MNGYEWGGLVRRPVRRNHFIIYPHFLHSASSPASPTKYISLSYKVESDDNRLVI
jgi:hypothetical protein